MLISFSVSNYRSFNEEMTLNLVASNKIEDHPNHKIPIPGTDKSALRSAVIYGANAAGKSNLVQALAVGQRLVLERSGRLPAIDAFRFRREALKEPTSFEFRFLVCDRVFTYGFDIGNRQFVGEWLSTLRGREETVVFERDDSGNTDVQAGEGLFPGDDIVRTLKQLKTVPMRKDQLFLNRAIGVPESAQGPILRALIGWFANDLVVVPSGARTHNVLERLHADPGFTSFCSKFFDRVGTGIGGLEVLEYVRDASEIERQFLGGPSRSYFNELFPSRGHTDIRPAPDDPTKVIERILMAHHPTGQARYTLPFSEESDGTQSLLHLMPILSPPVTPQGKVVVIDELDRSLHPLLCWEFIRFYSESCPEARRQLIVTTHEVHLLDQDLLRRDEYWFVEKDKSQQTQLYSLSDFKIRKDLRLGKGYLMGRFGAVPVIGGTRELERLLECSPEANDAAQGSAT